MWLATSFGFYKIHQPQAGRFHVCARNRQDLMNLIQLAEHEHPIEEGTDPEECPFRVTLDQGHLGSLLAALALTLDQGMMEGKGPQHVAKLEAFHRIWTALAALQEADAGPQ